MSEDAEKLHETLHVGAHRLLQEYDEKRAKRDPEKAAREAKIAFDIPINSELEVNMSEEKGVKVFNLDDYATNEEAKNQPVPTTDLEGLQNPKGWSYRPFCPIVMRKRDGSLPDFAVVLENEPGRVYHLGMFDLIYVNQGKQKEMLGDAKVTEYASWEKMLEAGWQVD